MENLIESKTLLFIKGHKSGKKDLSPLVSTYVLSFLFRKLSVFSILLLSYLITYILSLFTAAAMGGLDRIFEKTARLLGDAEMFTPLSIPYIVSAVLVLVGWRVIGRKERGLE